MRKIVKIYFVVIFFEIYNKEYCFNILESVKNKLFDIIYVEQVTYRAGNFSLKCRESLMHFMTRISYQRGILLHSSYYYYTLQN